METEQLYIYMSQIYCVFAIHVQYNKTLIIIIIRKIDLKNARVTQYIEQCVAIFSTIYKMSWQSNVHLYIKQLISFQNCFGVPMRFARKRGEFFFSDFEGHFGQRNAVSRVTCYRKQRVKRPDMYIVAFQISVS
jgi:hypothetical protein